MSYAPLFVQGVLTVFERLRAIATRAKREVRVYQRVIADERTPRAAKLLLGAAVGYLLLPFDLIPDFIPVLGQVDDVLIVPGLVVLALRLVPDALLAEHRAAVEQKRDEG